MKRISILFSLLAAVVATASSRADTFGSGASSFEIEFVTIGNPGNPADTTGDPNPAGSVAYAYRIGKYEIPEDAVRKANAQSALDGAPLGLTLDTRGPNKPATSLSWFEAARFVNWLNTSTGSTPAYKFDAGGNFQLWSSGDPGGRLGTAIFGRRVVRSRLFLLRHFGLATSVGRAPEESMNRWRPTNCRQPLTVGLRRDGRRSNTNR